MGQWSRIVIAVAAAAAVIGLLFASGAISIGRGDDTPEVPPTEDLAVDNGDGKADAKAKGRSGRRKRKRKSHRGKKTGEELESLGYIGLEPIAPENIGKVGVTINTKGIPPKLMLYTPCGWGKRFMEKGQERLREARLIDREGKLVRKWHTDFLKDDKRGWAMAKLGPDGSLVAVHARAALVKLDWDSKLVWANDEYRFHHDLSIEDNGDVLALIEAPGETEYGGETYGILDNAVVILGPDGKIKQQHWLLEQIEDSEFFQRNMKRVSSRRKKKRRDMIHANTIDTLPQDIEGVGNKGDLLTCMRNQNTIAILDRESGVLKWSWGAKDLDRPHDPTVTENGTILIFDNGWHRRFSRAVELDPRTNKVVWEHGTPGSEKFYTKMRGLAKPLPGGNVLISSSAEGRAFEVTREGKVLWEFWGPDIHENHRVPIRMVQLPEGSLKELEKRVKNASKPKPDGNAKPDSKAEPDPKAKAATPAKTK